MKKEKRCMIIIGCMAVLTFCVVGCGNTSAKSDNSSETQTGESSKQDKETISIDDIEWSVDESIVDGERYVLLELINNFTYPISSFELTFKEKSEITQEQKDTFYSEVQTKFKLSDEDMNELKERDIAMHADTDRVILAGNSQKDVNCYYFSGSYYLKNIKHYDLVEPDIATIKYVSDNQIYTVYYDFASKKYSTDDKTEVAFQWTNTELGNKVPKPDVQVLESGRDDESIFMFDAYGLSLEQFNSYVEECKNLGYTVDPGEFEGFYSADNEDGYNVYLYYNEGDERMSGTVESPEE